MAVAPTPPWGTPVVGGARSGATAGLATDPAATSPAVAREGLGFVLIVEQLTGSGESSTWRVSPAPIPAGPTRQQAREQAFYLAQTFRPDHPFSPQDRAVHRIDEDNYLTIVTGRTKSFHFRVSVAERLGTI